jgi:hypothetical protein
VLPVEPVEVLTPEDEVVHLLDLDAPAVPLELPPELPAALVERARPDLRRDRDVVTAAVEGAAERQLCAAVHRRGVDEAHAGVERGVHDLAREPGIGVERPPGAEPHDGAESPLLHGAAVPAAA